MRIEEIIIGTRVYNHGDRANREHWGTITRIIRRPRFSPYVEITPDPDQGIDRRPYQIPPCGISDVDSGTGRTPIVTEEAYRAYKRACLEALKRDYERFQARKR